MSLKNYYAVLGVPRGATPEEIKKAFREAAKKYHPDKAPDNPFAAAHFGEIQEAYEVLSNESRRARYDEECWLRGLYQRRDAVRITPEWMLGEATRLRRHMDEVDTYRMNHAALRDYVLLLLSDEHLSILRDAADEVKAQLIQEIIASIRGLHQRYSAGVDNRLMLLAAGNIDLEGMVIQWKHERRREAFWNKYRPFLILLLALLMTWLMWRSR